MSNVLLISYDNGSHLPFFPLNLFYLTGALCKANHDVKIVYQDIHHFPDAQITDYIDKFEFKDNKKCDVVGLGFCAGYYQYRKAKGISAAVNGSRRRKEVVYVLGGHGPAAVPEFFIEKMGADTVVKGDGESAILDVAEKGTRGIIQGRPCNDDGAPLWLYSHLPIDVYRLIRWPTSERTDFCFPILSSRGCKWSCSFCYRMREGFHERDIGSIMAEIKYLHKNFGITHFQFADELLMSSEKRTEAICQAILRLPFKIRWDCNGRLNFATSNLLGIMKTAGALYINYGIESLSDVRLKEMGKGLTVDRITQGVEDTLKAGLSPGLNLLWGFPGEGREDLQRAVDFLKKYDPCDELRTIRPVTPYPGCKLYDLAIEKGLLEGPEDFYERKHVNSDLFTANFMDMSVGEAHKALYEANHKLCMNYYSKRAVSAHESMDKLYLKGDTSFRGFRSV